MKKYVQFLLALLEHQNQLQALLGTQWPAMSAQLYRLLLDIIKKQDDRVLPALVNRIYRSFSDTPAEALVGTLYRQAAYDTHHLDRGNNSKSISNPTRSDTVLAVGPNINRTDNKREFEVASTPADLIVAAQELAQSIAPLREETKAEPTDAPPQNTEKRINVWVSERTVVPIRPLTIGERYTLNLGVGKPVAAGLIGGNSANVPEKDLKGGGLQTEWEVITSAFELKSVDPQVVLSATPLIAPTLWIAKFALSIPEDGESDVRRILIVPRSHESCRLEVLIYAIRGERSEVYRQFSIELIVEGAAKAGAENAALVQSDLIFAPSNHMALRTTHEWTTPPGRLAVNVFPGLQKASVRGDWSGKQVNDLVDWFAQQDVVKGPIDLVREAAERFRGRWEQYLNDIDVNGLQERLAGFTRTYDWATWQSRADFQHADSWVKASTSSELRDLAILGHELYQVAFPPNQPLRNWMDSLPPGSRLDITWMADAASAGNVPNVPWGLMYQPDPPNLGVPADPMGFLALRFRLGYWAYRGVSDASKALGAMTNAHQAYCLYWGSHPKDETGNEAVWQRQQFQSWQNQIFAPLIPGSPDARAEVLQALSAPQQRPTSVVYFFCQAAVGYGHRPVLQFGPTSGLADVLQTTDLLAGRTLVDQPLVFANACTTSSADPYIANLLQQSLFRRGCRGFLGTETKVPIQLASRLAVIFFKFFYRSVDPAPMAAGEALAQTRLFLLTEYANIGGIFYTYLNQYELYMADDAEVQTLRL